MSGFTSFLKAAGEAIANGALAYVGLPPIFKPTAPASTGVVTTASELAQIAAAAIQIEAIAKSTGLTGAQKLAALQPQVYGILQNSLNIGNHPMGDPALCQKGSQEIAQGVVDFINGLKSTDAIPGTTTMPVITIVAPPNG